MKLTEMQDDNLIKVILAGNPGTGKSSAGISFPKPMLVFSYEARMKSVINYYKRIGRPEVLDGIDIITINNYLTHDKKLSELKFGSTYKTIGFDSLTSMADMILLDLLSGRGENRKRVAGKIDIPGFDEFNGEDSALKEWVFFCKAYPGNIWVSAHYVASSISKSEKTQKAIIQRDLLTAGKKIASKIPAYFDEVWVFQIEASIDTSKPPESYDVLTVPNSVDYAKTALSLPPKFNWKDKVFWEVLQSQLNEGTK